MYEEPESPKEGGVFKVYGAPESPSEGSCFRYMRVVLNPRLLTVE